MLGKTHKENKKNYNQLSNVYINSHAEEFKLDYNFLIDIYVYLNASMQICRKTSKVNMKRFTILHVILRFRAPLYKGK